MQIPKVGNPFQANQANKASEANSAAASQGAPAQQMQMAGNLNQPSAAAGLGNKLNCCA